MVLIRLVRKGARLIWRRSDFPGTSMLQKMTVDVLRLDAEALQQFVRASHAFSLGIQAGSIDLSLSFLLLVTAIECLSSLEGFIPNAEMNKDSKSTERYVQFVKRFCSDLPTFYGHDGEEGFTRNLKTVYHVHRSGFVHAGKEVSAAAVSTADELKLSSVTHYVDGKQIDTPRLNMVCTSFGPKKLGWVPWRMAQEIHRRPERLARDSST